MKSLEGLPRPVTWLTGVIVVAAMMIPAVTSSSARRAGFTVLAADAKHDGTVIRPFRVKGQDREHSLISAVAQKTEAIAVPVAITVFPQEVYRPPESWARRAFRNLSDSHHAEKGGHVAAWEYPEVFAAELRAAFQPLRRARLIEK